MTDEASYDSMKAWIASRPECVRRLAAEFQPMDLVQMPDGGRWHIIGYTERDELIVAPWREDYEEMDRLSQRVPAAFYRPQRKEP